MTKPKIKINFCDNDETFVNKEKNVFIEILQKFYDIEISPNPDFLFFSCFGTKHYSFTNCVKIYYTNENVIPDFNECDYGIGFHHINFEDRFLRCTEYNLKLQPQIQDRKNLPDILAKRKFCNFVYSNRINGGGASLRTDFCKKLSQYKHIDCPGKVLNNMQNAIAPRNGDWQQGKLDFLSNYKFTIAFENRKTNGYTTEKNRDWSKGPLWFDVEKNGYTTKRTNTRNSAELWFDVEKNGYTTKRISFGASKRLWFDVEKNGYTTRPQYIRDILLLWFDVEKNGYTTPSFFIKASRRCGLM